ncbi:MAG TPA: translesion error-prone DNA polymerase V autoproteolytic subunit [Ignavibacteriales bacterium]|nr:translesion error-prone DNA polymerase V autoproteolytic subunit [Ignavibacteriales bacterium]HOL81793.1 translesion error-prone DNA polymerase V autoproteolytic subunit [Ignavibacteriales bacterium]HOM65832.1 translesion error-prone DNA polymerase V autoproteolytic subunit [Ignavibacteriales bacterium]HPD67065.1 translesion error-prone DNA polymerase V autoproteolytic subunit [Ignavibacteriales bacterium]HPP33930.1 translesion error-prone DNA polymerase V autoproteolytic subunit [Ignavibact
MKVLNIVPIDNSTNISLPLFVSNIPAGFPSPADDYLDKSLDLNKYLITNPAASFFVKVEGDSMINAGILSGDILIVDRSIEKPFGKIIVALLNNEFTVKRLVKSKNRVYLMPENPKYPNIELTEQVDFQVWGVVTGLVRKF